MRLLFLDIDGVLNCDESFDHYVAHRDRTGEKLASCQSYYFAPWSVKALNRITDATGARIVISSSWRDDMQLVRERFKHWGVTGTVIGRTPIGLKKRGVLYVPDYANRGEEIDAYLVDYQRRQFERKRFWRADYLTRYAILDDSDIDSGNAREPHAPFFFQTSFAERGLTDEIADAVIWHFEARHPLIEMVTPCIHQAAFVRPLALGQACPFGDIVESSITYHRALQHRAIESWAAKLS